MKKGTTYNQLSYYQRLRMNEMLEQGIAKSRIAEKLGVHRSTIFNELKRGNNNGKYDPEFAEMRAQDNFEKKRCKTVIESNKRLAEYISHLILDCHLSPEKITEQLKGQEAEFGQVPSSPVTIYTAIDRGLIPNVTRADLTEKIDVVPVVDGGIRFPMWLRKELRMENGDKYRIECRMNGNIVLKKVKR